MSKTVATLTGVNFAPIAVDEAGGVAYGLFQSISQKGVAAVDLASGKMTIVSLMSASDPGIGGMTYADGWLVWSQGESHTELRVWSLQAWNAVTHEERQITPQGLADGTYPTNGTDPMVGHGYVAWIQIVSSTSTEVRVYRFATGTVTTLDSGNVSSPVFAGRYLVWGKKGPAADSPVAFHFADAATLEPADGPPELSKPYPASYLAGSPDYMLWIALLSTRTTNNTTMSVDELATHRITVYSAAGDHYLQFPVLAGPYLVWFGGDRSSVVDLRTAAGFDIPLPGGASAAGDTIVVAKIAVTKGFVGDTTVSVLHPSQLSRLVACGS